MAIKISFGGKTIVEPGSYSRIIGGGSQIPPSASFGKIMIIDTGKNLGFGFGAGINGELSQGKSCVYEFADIDEFKNAMGGGLFYDLSNYLFRPSSNGQGVESIKYVRAATTTAGSLSYTFTGSAYITKTGTITTSNASTAVTGVGTKFTEELSVGDTIADDATDTAIGVVAVINSDTSLTLVANGASTNAGIAYSARFKQTQGGTFTIKSRTEGLCGNGILLNGTLVKGFAAKLESGVVDTSKFIISFYQGGFKGINYESKNFILSAWSDATTYAVGNKVHYNGIAWKSLTAGNLNNTPDLNPTDWEIENYNDNFDDTNVVNSNEEKIFSSPEFSNLVELYDWMDKNPTFNSYFKLTSSSFNGEGKIDGGDLVANSDYELIAGGTTEFNSEDFDSVLNAISDEDHSFFLVDDYDQNAKSSNNSKLLFHVKNDCEFEKGIVIGGGYNHEYFKGTAGSLGTAQYFNSSKVMVVHGGIKVSKFGGGFKELTSIYSAALFLGRTAGLEPQVPTTWKDISIASPIHELTKKERELALLGGVIHFKFVPGKNWVINQSINTLQRNDTLFLPDGDSYEVSIERIKWQLNKELILNSRVIFVGGNLNTASAEDVKLFTEGYLISRTARPNKDNLIMSFKDIKVTLQGDAWKIGYGFVANSPINKLFFTGVMLDANISI